MVIDGLCRRTLICVDQLPGTDRAPTAPNGGRRRYERTHLAADRAVRWSLRSGCPVRPPHIQVVTRLPGRPGNSTGSRWSRRSLRRVAGGPDGNARSAADMGGCLVPDGAASESSDLRDLRAGGALTHTGGGPTRAPTWAAGNPMCDAAFRGSGADLRLRFAVGVVAPFLRCRWSHVGAKLRVGVRE
jgi:hypothetical protein